jgi:hypothetical protein
VYRNAYYVSIWLGNEGEEIDLAMDILEKFEEAWHTFKTTDYEAFRQGYIQFRKDNEHLTQHWMALEKLMKRPRFQRRWIIQETVLARRKEVSCGGRTVDWSALYHLSQFLDNNDIERPCHLLRSLHEASHFQEQGALEHLTLERLCQDFHHSICKDPRDIIYSLFALATDVDTKDQPWLRITRRLTRPWTCFFEFPSISSINLKVLMLCSVVTLSARHIRDLAPLLWILSSGMLCRYF